MIADYWLNHRMCQEWFRIDQEIQDAMRKLNEEHTSKWQRFCEEWSRLCS